MDDISPTTPAGFSQHDHTHCVAQALEKADAYCLHHQLRFTEVRRRTLGILLESHCALGAYDVLDRLHQEGLGSKPPVAYRALNFLLDHGFIHRVERLNAFVACALPGAQHEPMFLICTECKRVAETPAKKTSGLAKTAQQSGFEIQYATMEAEGRCPKCQADSIK